VAKYFLLKGTRSIKDNKQKGNNNTNTMPTKKFIPFSEIKDLKKLIIVDGQHAQGLVLSHWKGANKIPELAADTSGEIVLNAIQVNWEGIDYPNITATHFDIDGFVGVWALFHQALARKYDAVLRQVAIIGDFRHFDAHNEAALTALKLVCWLNAVEKNEFYRPFGSNDELEDCVAKFYYFLPRFEAVLENPTAFESDWREEFEEVMSGVDKMKSAKIRTYENIRLYVVEIDEPIHYYALMGERAAYDMILSLYSNNRYELEIKYTTWVDIVSRPTLPRLQMQPLVDELNKLEKSDCQWFCDKITDTGPILRLEATNLSKADRYANPTEREIYASSISASLFEELVLAFFVNGYEGVEAKRGWTWKEVKLMGK
jgi:hypothetical protein